MADLPKDPMILLSVVNTKLRDFYADLDTLCQEMQIEKKVCKRKSTGDRKKSDFLRDDFRLSDDLGSRGFIKLILFHKETPENQSFRGIFYLYNNLCDKPFLKTISVIFLSRTTI